MGKCRCDDMDRCKTEIAQLENEALKTINTCVMALSLHDDAESLSKNTVLGIKSGNITEICFELQSLDGNAVEDNKNFFDKIRRKIQDLRDYYDELEVEDTEYHEEEERLLDAVQGTAIN